MNTTNFIGYMNSRKASIARVLNLVATTFSTESHEWEEMSLLNLANSILLSPATYFAIVI